MDYCNSLNSSEDIWTCYQELVQNSLDAPKVWIGMYIAAASAVCGLLMTLDVFNGFKTKKLWFPCKYFSLNATSLTLLSVAMKLTMDLTSTKINTSETFAGYSTFVLMSTAMCNFMTSLASMTDNDIILNLTALGILIITVVINQWIFIIQINKTRPWGLVLLFDDYVSIFLLILLILSCTSAIIAPTTKSYVETKFKEMHKMVLNERVHGEKVTAQELRVILKKYWMMAGTGNPQFVLARSVICVIPSIICLTITIGFLVHTGVAVEGYNIGLLYSEKKASVSIYRWSSNWIFIIQTVVAVIGTIAPTSRLFVAARFRSLRTDLISFKVELKTEKYWTQRLIHWKESPIQLQFRCFKIKKILYISKKVLLNTCTKIQVMIVLTSKLVLIISSWFINVAFKFIHHINVLRFYVFKFKSDTGGHEPIAAGTNELDFSPYVMLLEGEFELPKGIIANISMESDKLIQVGKMRKPKKIIELLQKSKTYSGVGGFERKKSTCLRVQEPRTSWSISLVTLTSIAVAIPDIPSNIVNNLFHWVNEGLPFVKFIEKRFDSTGELRSIRETADVIWEQLELDQKQKEKDGVQGNGKIDKTYKDTLRKLSTEAEATIAAFKNKTTDSVMNNPLNWPIEVIAANSMYNVCKSLLLIENDATTMEFFERLSIIISEVLAACLTNLAHVLFTECYINPIEKRQESTRRALILFGESEEIIQCLEQREWPNLDPDKAGYIEEWQAIMEPGNEVNVNSVSTTDDLTSALQPSPGQVVINLGSSF